MFEFIVRAQVVATCVRGTTERTLKPAGEVDVVVVPDVRHDLAAQLAPVKVAAAWHPVKGQPHVPGFWTCNINTRQVTFNCWPPNTTYTTTSRPRPTLCVDGGSIASLFLSLFFFPLIYTLSLSFSQSQFLPLRLLRLLLISSSSSFVSSASLLFSPLIARLFLSFTFFFFFFHYLPTNFPIRLPSYLRIKAVIVPRVYIYVYTRSLFPLFPSFRREVFLHASLFKATTFLLHPREARSFTRHPSSKCRAAVWRARERIEGRWWIDRCILAGPRTSFFFFFLRFEKGRCISRVQKKEKEIRIFFFFSPLMKIGWEFKRAHALTKRKKKYVSRI